ncbi:hypothetical protein AOC05_13545 [Arthrobacter alpinus]|uniref:Clp R domain-containing protein n=1 Tax=Arthrobacter alpinus TaxID=656366 RepID=A0A0M5LXQ7_9MICC|nr:hypothetical protein AOC05_13545 [Arthrobacter alpinus]
MAVFELFTDSAEAVMRHVVDEARGVQAKEIEPVHLLLGIMDHTDGIARHGAGGRRNDPAVRGQQT